VSPITRLAWWWLRRRGWAVQVNTPEDCTNVYESHGKRFDSGWVPLHSIRYGKTPVYRVGPNRWVGPS
jgi:hypothetical protein